MRSKTDETCYSRSIIYFSTFLTSKFLSFLSNFLSIENDLSTAAEVGWAFCNSALLVGSIVKLVQFIIVSKSKLDSRLLMQSLIAQVSSSNCIFFSSPYALVVVQALPSKNSTLAARVRY